MPTMSGKSYKSATPKGYGKKKAAPKKKKMDPKKKKPAMKKKAGKKSSYK